MRSDALILLQARTTEVALPLAAVHRVVEIPPDELYPVPRAPCAVLGVANHWGRIVTVVDLAQLLDTTVSSPSHQTAGPLPVLFLEQSHRQIGALVTGLSEIITTPKQKRLESRADSLITHMVELDDRAVGVVSPERLLQGLRQRFADAARA